MRPGMKQCLMKQGAQSRAERLEHSQEAAGPKCGGEQAELSRSCIAACQARSHYLLRVIQPDPQVRMQCMCSKVAAPTLASGSPPSAHSWSEEVKSWPCVRSGSPLVCSIASVLGAVLHCTSNSCDLVLTWLTLLTLLSLLTGTCTAREVEPSAYVDFRK